MKRWKGTAGGATPPPVLTPDALAADETLSDEQKAMVYDDLFEWHGDDDDGDDFELYADA